MSIEFKKDLAVSQYDVAICGGGTGGVFAAIAAARNGAKTVLIEAKGYVGGIAAEGGCGLHSFYNCWGAFPNETTKRKVVRGIPEEFIDRLTQMNGASGHNDSIMGGNYDSDALCVDVEKYKYLANLMLIEAGVTLKLNTTLCDAISENGTIKYVIIKSHAGMEAIKADAFVDSTGYGDLSASAGATFNEPNDMDVANSMGISGLDIEKYCKAFKDHDALAEYSTAKINGKEKQIIRIHGSFDKIDPEFGKQSKAIGMQSTTTTIYDNYLMFIKINCRMKISPTNVDALTEAEFELRKRQQEGIKLLRKYIPGAENAFIARTGPCVAIRRGRCIDCEYILSNEDITAGKHFCDDVMSYGFHDMAPKYHIAHGDSYGIPYRAIIPVGMKNLFSIGMMISKTHEAHMSTRNTVCCMGQGQAAGTAAALISKEKLDDSRKLDYKTLYDALVKGGVWFDVDPFTGKNNF